MSDAAFRFLRALMRWQGVAAPQDLDQQNSMADTSARQFCKRKGLVTFANGYWRITDAGRTALASEAVRCIPTP